MLKRIAGLSPNGKDNPARPGRPPTGTLIDPALRSSEEAINYLLSELRTIGARTELGADTAFIHFVYGFKTREDFPFYAYMAIKSAQELNPGWPVVMCYVNEPTGPWWEKIKPTITIIQMPMFTYFLGAKFYHYAHKADVVRLLMLRELGGIYLDMDTLTVRSFRDLLAHDFGMAVQGGFEGTAAGLCNAIMWGKPNAAFLTIWIAEYASFASKGRDGLWDYHSVKLPAILARYHHDKITILNHNVFFYPLWMDLERILLSEGSERHLPHLQYAYAFHLWNGATEKALRALSPESIKSSTSAYAHFARKILGFPAPPPLDAAVPVRPSTPASSETGPLLPAAAPAKRLNKPLVSIVMPTLNSERFIRQALNSIIEQTYENIELIVVDGGSTDHTLDIVRQYKQVGDIRIVESTRGLGMAHDLNLGLSHARGGLIARMDADDIAFNWRIEAQEKFLCDYPDVALVGSGAERFWESAGEARSPLWSDHIRDMYLVNNPFFHPTVMFSRHLVDSGIMRYDEQFKADEDYELWGRVIQSAITANMDCSTIRYRIHSTNGQRMPNKVANKKIALERFCKGEGIYTPELVDALTEFQVSAFVSPSVYSVLADYARTARAYDDVPNQRPLPKLGWIQWAITELPTYADFMRWYYQAKNWKVEP
jgi:hypothetical protein